MSKNIFIECDCYSEGMRLNYDLKDKLLYISLYQRGFRPRTKTLLEKLRWVWHILKNDVPYDDEVVLGLKKISQLKKFLNSI